MLLIALPGAFALAGCGDRPSVSGPTASAPPMFVATPPSTIAASMLQTHGSLGVLLPGDTEQFTATLAPANVDVTAAVAWDSLTPGVLSVTSGLVRALAPGVGQLRAAHQGLTRIEQILVAAVTPPPEPGPSRRQSRVVIAEFRPAGDGGSRDEFVELQNRSDTSVDIGGWSIAWSDSAGGTGTLGRFFPGATLAPGQRFLLINVMCPACFNGPAAAFDSQDYRFRGDLPERGGLALVDADGSIEDQVGFAGPARYQEGAHLTAAITGDTSYSRQGDSGDNSVDFRPGSPSPQGSACRSNGRCP